MEIFEEKYSFDSASRYERFSFQIGLGIIFNEYLRLIITYGTGTIFAHEKATEPYQYTLHLFFRLSK